MWLPLSFLALLLLLLFLFDRYCQNNPRKENATLYHLLFEASNDAVFLHDIGGSIVEVNERAVDLLGYTREELLQMSIADLVPTGELRLAGTSQWFDDGVRFETLKKHKDGRLIPVEGSGRHVQMGGKNRILLSLRDITDRKKAEKQLRESEERYRRLVEYSPNAIAVHQEFKVVYVNRALIQLMGAKSADDLLQKSVLDIIHADYREVGIQRARQIYEDGKPAEALEEKIRRLDGTVLDVEISGVPITYQGQPATLVVVRDLTHQKQAEKHRLELMLERERINVLQQFIANASHDLKTPLSTIKLQVFLAQKSPPENLPKIIGKLEAQVLQLEKLVEDLFKMSDLDRNAVTFNFQPLQVNTLLKPLTDAYTSALQEKTITLTLQTDAPLPDVLADQTHLYNALSNILNNAIAYTRGGGKIQIRTRAVQNQVCIEVLDSGIGITPEELPHIFERFYRGDKARSTRGTGLGLSIALKIVEAHHGKIEVESTVGVGSLFRICLPSIH